MALARTYSTALAGVQGHVVEVEAEIENGVVALLLVGPCYGAAGGQGTDQVGNHQQQAGPPICRFSEATIRRASASADTASGDDGGCKPAPKNATIMSNRSST